MYLTQTLSYGDIGSLLGLSERTVRRYLHQFYQTGDVEPREHKNGPNKCLSEHEQLLILKTIIRNPGIYLHEIQSIIEEAVGVTVHVATICRTLKFMGCSRQVIRHVAVDLIKSVGAKVIFLPPYSPWNLFSTKSKSS